MSIFSPCLVLYDVDQPKTTTTTKEERDYHKAQRRTARMRALVETLDAIVRKSK